MLIGGILQRPVKILRQQAQELPINATLPSLGSQLYVLRVDYQAIITDEAGKEHKVLIELQKLRRQQDIGWFPQLPRAKLPKARSHHRRTASHQKPTQPQPCRSPDASHG